MCLSLAAPIRTRSPSPPSVHSSAMEIATPLLEMGFTWPHIRNAIFSTGLMATFQPITIKLPVFSGSLQLLT